MKTLRSYVEGRWHQAETGFAELVNPCSEEPIARASSAGVDFAAALEFARQRGGPALRELDFKGRGEMLAGLSRALHEHRDELIALSLQNTGTTRKDAKFDLDGATYTLSHYAQLGEALGTQRFLVDGDGDQLGRSPRYWGQHVLLPLDGCAVHINAFNFPAWGFAEKAACSLLAGVPLLTKPATSSAMVAERCVEIVIESGLLPAGAVSLVCGSLGDALDHLGPQDLVAFTGSASTALALRGKPDLLSTSTRFNVEADSLNAAVLGPDVDTDSETWLLFLRDVEREITQKSGQKCTAARRVLVPSQRIAAVQDELAERLAAVTVGNPAEAGVTMGPLATVQQLQDTVSGVAELGAASRLVHGSGQRIDGKGNPPGRGFFFGPTLMLATDPAAAILHEREVFGPVSTLIPYDGSAAEAGALVALAGGTLVTSLYSDDPQFLGDYLARAGSTTGRVYIGSEKAASHMPGSGTTMPQLLHGGPGRAGGGEELGGLRGLGLYLQRVALAGDRALIERLAGLRGTSGGPGSQRR